MITVLGANGFIGSHLLRRLSYLSKPCYAPDRHEELTGRYLGDVIYCIGLTADFRERPFDTVEAHVCELLKVVRDCQYDNIVYLSSTRIYNHAMTIAKEAGIFQVAPDNLSDLYNISKLMGEAIINSLGDLGCIVRLSNVYGQDMPASNFLSRIIRDAITLRHISLETSMDSEKDYIYVDDVVDLLIQIVARGSKKIYNIASGVNISNQEITDKLSLLTGCEVRINHEAKTIKFPPISIDLIESEFGFKPSNLLVDMENLIQHFRR